MADFFNDIEDIEIKQEEQTETFEPAYEFCISNIGKMYRTGLLCDDDYYRKYIQYRLDNVRFHESDIRYRIVLNDTEKPMYADSIFLSVWVAGTFGSVRDILSFMDAIDIADKYGEKYRFMNGSLSDQYVENYKRILWFFTHKFGKLQGHANAILPCHVRLKSEYITFIKITCEQILNREVDLREIMYYSNITWKMKSVVSDYKNFQLFQEETLLGLNTIAYENINNCPLEDPEDDILRLFVRNPSISKEKMENLLCGEYCENDLKISFAIRDFLHTEFVDSRSLTDNHSYINGCDAIGYYKTHTLYNHKTWDNRKSVHNEENECLEYGVYSDIMNVLLYNAHMFKHKRKMAPHQYKTPELEKRERYFCNDIEHAYRYSPRENGYIYISTVLRELFIKEKNQILVVSLALYGPRPKVENLITKLLEKS